VSIRAEVSVRLVAEVTLKCNLRPLVSSTRVTELLYPCFECDEIYVSTTAQTPKLAYSLYRSRWAD